VSDPPRLEHRRFTAADGARLVGDLAVPERAQLAAIVCHPHPLYGGDRFNQVVSALFEALPRADIAALRFDFRTEFSGGPGERLDAIAALDELVAAVPDVPVAVLGYSFGAIVALGLGDERVTALGLVAPPLAMASGLPAPAVRTLVLTPAHDQFSPPAVSAPIVAGWSAATVEHHKIEMADHSLAGRTGTVAELVTAWLSP
jgi:uncharacterized protein